jgi:hypothetical protein
VLVENYDAAAHAVRLWVDGQLVIDTAAAAPTECGYSGCVATGAHVVVGDTSLYFDLKVEYEHRTGNAGLSLSASSLQAHQFMLDSRFLWCAEHVSGSPFVVTVFSVTPAISSFSLDVRQLVVSAQFYDVFGDVLKVAGSVCSSTVAVPSQVSLAIQAHKPPCFLYLRELILQNDSMVLPSHRLFAVDHSPGCVLRQIVAFDLCVSGSLDVELFYSRCVGQPDCSIDRAEAAPMQHPASWVLGGGSEQKTVVWSGYIMFSCSYASKLSLFTQASCSQDNPSCNSLYFTVGQESSYNMSHIMFMAVPFTLYPIQLQYSILADEVPSQGSLFWESSCHPVERVPPRYFFRPLASAHQSVTFAQNESADPRTSNFSVVQSQVTAGESMFITINLRNLFGLPVSVLSIAKSNEYAAVIAIPNLLCANAQMIVQQFMNDATHFVLRQSCLHSISVLLLKTNVSSLPATFYRGAFVKHPISTSSITMNSDSFSLETQPSARSLRILGFLRIPSVNESVKAVVRLSVDSDSPEQAKLFMFGRCIFCCTKMDISCFQNWAEVYLNSFSEQFELWYPITFEFYNFTRLSVSNFSIELLSTTYRLDNLFAGFGVGQAAEVTVAPSHFSPRRSRFSGPLVLIGGSIGNFEVQIRDDYDNTVCLNDGSDSLQFVLSPDIGPSWFMRVTYGCNSLLEVAALRTSFNITAFYRGSAVSLPLHVGVLCDTRFSSVSLPDSVAAGTAFDIQVRDGNCLESALVNGRTMHLEVVHLNKPSLLMSLTAYGESKSIYFRSTLTASGFYHLALHAGFVRGAVSVTFYDTELTSAISEMLLPMHPIHGVSLPKNSIFNPHVGMPVCLEFGLDSSFAGFTTDVSAVDLKFEYADVLVNHQHTNIEVHVQSVPQYLTGIHEAFSVLLKNHSIVLILLNITGYIQLSLTHLLWKMQASHVFQKVPVDYILGLNKTSTVGSVRRKLQVLPSVCRSCFIQTVAVDGGKVTVHVVPKDLYGNSVVSGFFSSMKADKSIAVLSYENLQHAACSAVYSDFATKHLVFSCPAHPATNQTFKLLSFDTAGLVATYYDSINFTQPVSAQVDRAVRYSGNSSSLIHNSLTSPADWSVRWSGFFRGGVSFSGNASALLQLQSSDLEGVRLWVHGALIFDYAKADYGTAVSRDFALPLYGNPVYEVILEYWHSQGPFNLTFSLSDPFRSFTDEFAFEVWQSFCPDYPNGALVSFPYEAPVEYGREVIWQPSTIWTVGLAVLFNIKTVDSFGNLSQTNPNSVIFFCFVTGSETPTDVAEIADYRIPLQSRWVVCANEGQTCFFPGAQIVGYGSEGVPFVFKQALERISCEAESFSAVSRNNASVNQCYLSVKPAIFAVSKYNSSYIQFVSPEERLKLFVAFRSAVSGAHLTLFSSADCSPHSLVAQMKSALHLNCSDLGMLAPFHCIQLDGAIVFNQTGLYEIGVQTSDDVMFFIGLELVLRSSASLQPQIYSFVRYFEASDTALFRASIIPSTDSCTTTFFWKLSIPGVA